MSKNTNKHHKAVMGLYIGIGLSLLLSLVPILSFAIISLLLFIGVLIASYVVRGKTETGSFAENHATFIIRTLWIVSFISLITIGIASFYMFGRLDYSLLNPCINDLSSRGIAYIESAGTQELYRLIQPCADNFIDANIGFFITAALIAGGPVLIYVGYRLFRGVCPFKKGAFIVNHKSWF